MLGTAIPPAKNSSLDPIEATRRMGWNRNAGTLQPSAPVTGVSGRRDVEMSGSSKDFKEGMA
jgi:hypothetical protein